MRREREKTNAKKAVGNAFKPDISLQLNTRSICEYDFAKKYLHTHTHTHTYMHSFDNVDGIRGRESLLHRIDG
jgi:hypothetical protein